MISSSSCAPSETRLSSAFFVSASGSVHILRRVSSYPPTEVTFPVFLLLKRIEFCVPSEQVDERDDSYAVPRPELLLIELAVQRVLPGFGDVWFDLLANFLKPALELGKDDCVGRVDVDEEFRCRPPM